MMTAAIVIAALLGVLMLNSGHVSAEKAATTVLTEASAETGAASVFGDQTVYEPLSALPSLAKLLGALFVVVVCIYVGVFLLKKVMGKKYTGGRQSDVLEVLESSFIAPKKSVTLLRVGDKSVLVGVSENQMTVLTELDADETATILARSETEQPETASFKNVLSTATEKIKEMRFIKQKKAVVEA